MNSIPVSYSNRLVFNYLSATNYRFKPSWQRPSPTRNVTITNQECQLYRLSHLADYILQALQERPGMGAIHLGMMELERNGQIVTFSIANIRIKSHFQKWIYKRNHIFGNSLREQRLCMYRAREVDTKRFLHQKRFITELRPFWSALCYREQAKDQTRPAIWESHLPQTVLWPGCNSPWWYFPACFHLW